MLNSERERRPAHAAGADLPPAQTWAFGTSLHRRRASDTGMRVILGLHEAAQVNSMRMYATIQRMVQGIKVAPSGATKITTLRLAAAVLARASSPRLARHVAERLQLDAPATLADTLRVALKLGLDQLESDARGHRVPAAAGRRRRVDVDEHGRAEVVRPMSEADRKELAEFERVLTPRLWREIAASFQEMRGKARPAAAPRRTRDR